MKSSLKKQACSWLFFIVLVTSCNREGKERLFKRQDAARTGVDFSNTITESDSVNLFVNEYAYMGGGVGVGDFNNDGKPDLFFSGSQVSCRLYINEGNGHFTDITEKAGLHTDAWCTGVSVVDINNDGYPDIYVCVSGNLPGKKRRNLLFINNHDLTFTEEAAAYGLDYSGYCTQAVFFDYDRDGDLDMYLLNHRLDPYRPNDINPKDTSGHSPAADRLFCNTGIDKEKGHPVYKDVSVAAGIKEDGFGLGVVVSDFNNDGWPDIYVSNDYLANDELWLNNKNGTFSNCIADAIKHQSYSSMGVDAADINNDGKIDLMTLDMMPENNQRKKTMFSFLNYERYQMERDSGYQPEFMRNMLQLNNGNFGKVAAAGKEAGLPFFSEIGQLAGVSETDWSWSILFADFNNDGWKDIHITNGMGRDLTNEDFVQFRSEHFSVDDIDEKARTRMLMKKLAEYGSIPLQNYLYINNHHLGFDPSGEASGIDNKTTSNGAVYVDLDNDGDLDLVINNINQEASVYINNTRERGGDPYERTQDAHEGGEDTLTGYIDFSLKGDSLNRDAIGTKISVYCGGQQQVEEEYPVRGYLSTVSKKLHFGVGASRVIDSAIVVWPDGKREVVRGIRAGQTLDLNYKDVADGGAGALAGGGGKAGAGETPTSGVDASGKPAAGETLGGADESGRPGSGALFTEVSAQINASYRHKETFFNDYSFQRLLPQKYSQLGPLISTGDIDKDGLTDFFIGGAYNYSGRLFTQKANGSFAYADLVSGKKEEEDMGSLLFDANGDGFTDLVIAGGSDEFSPGSPVYTPRLYINNGKGKLLLRPNAIPPSVNTSASVIAGADIDGDGDIDLFVGGRVSSEFPKTPRSYILRNDHGSFTDVTDEVCPALKYAGMITSAVWADIDNDHQPDLVIAGEWMPIRFFKNDHGKLHEITASTGLTHTSGQWRSLVARDIDGDGHIDIIAGNLGLNNKYHVSPGQPLMIYASDMGKNGRIDPIPFYYIKNESGRRELFPGISRDAFAEQVPSIKKKFLRYKDYAGARFDDIFSKEQQEGFLTLKCEETRSCVFENKGNGKFVMHPLPVEAQFAPVNAIVCEDLDGDGKNDLLLAGNEYQTDIMTGRYDASYGLFLKGDGGFDFTPVPPVQSGFIVNGDVKDLKTITTAKGDRLVLVAVNNDSLRVFRVQKPGLKKGR